MSTETQTTVIKKYANRRLYNTRTSAYVTLDTLAEMVRNDENFVVQDAKTNEDITRGVLGQIIFDAESRGSGLLPISFLRQLITFYGGQLQGLVPTYLEHSLSSFTREQEKLGRHINQTIGVQAFSAVEDQVRRNMDIFQRSMRMFMPYGAAGEQAEQANAQHANPAPAPAKDELLAKDVAALRDELASMQAKIAKLSGSEDPAAANHSPANDEAGDGSLTAPEKS
ncbi:polyhydroxyalkanoate synthesis repressor PhaR [Acuticoccus sp. MNP-M23]|uniref:polyhydroxyalkanoate synthesis repressor PhaR n=1 Tax=Acuticoccus sp. MNP-M23 TaxID=3072793 RepID=UPI002815BCC9|nr:polyhydroxyalkanoate synthesis repressor PhaR [Acuticoccus sp. MNP-M23]WMS42891.1 polyhydroxyalkanoate synthesis repressor PhaR [Acuticoccus sp. MNP-M23]